MENKSATTRVQSLAESGIKTVPPQYVRPALERAKEPAPFMHHAQIPVIDLHGLSVDYLREKTVAEISGAAEKWGFFQIVNHGIPDSLIARVLAAGKAFFDLPMEEKELYKIEVGGNYMGYGSKVGSSAEAKAADWKDHYYNIAWPVAQRDMSKWPKQPSNFTEVMDDYGREICKLWEVLMQALSMGLGLENENGIHEAVGGERGRKYISI